MKDQKFEEKFNYLIKEAEKKLKITDTNPLKEDDLIKIDTTLNYLEKKKSEKCKKEIEELFKHSSNFTNLDKLNIAYAEKGQQKEFDEAKNKLEDCLKPINFITKNFKEHISLFENIIQGSYDLCLNNIKDDIKKGKANEQIARNRIDACYNYFLKSKNSSSKIIEPVIESLMEKY